LSEQQDSSADAVGASQLDIVKNGLSDLTKVQEGWDQLGNDVKSDHQGKALKEGCHERREARMGVMTVKTSSK